MTRIYLAGSMRNPAIVDLANKLQHDTGAEVFADWCAVGPEADDHWRTYCMKRGLTYKQGLETAIAKNVFAFDKENIDRADIMVVAYPAGKSAHLELGYHIGRGKPGFILLDEQDRWDIMLQFATVIASNYAELLGYLSTSKPVCDKGTGSWMRAPATPDIINRLVENSDRDYEI